MAQAHEQDRPARVKKPPVQNRVIVRSAAVKAAAMKSNAGVTEVLISEVRFQRIAGKPRPLEKILAGYADSVSKAVQAGHFVTFSFRVSPDGDAEPVSFTNEGDELDAALVAARARGQAKVTEILKGEDMLTASEFGKLIGASHETVNVKRKRSEVLGLEGATRGVKYPRWQVIDGGLLLPGLQQLFATVGAPWTVYRFLCTTHAELAGRTGLDALREGQVEAALGVARNQVAGTFT
jgi:hypothetical protein